MFEEEKWPVYLNDHALFTYLGINESHYIIKVKLEIFFYLPFITYMLFFIGKEKN